MSVMMRNGVQYAGEPTDRLDNIEEIIGDGQQSVGSDLTDAVTQLNSRLVVNSYTATASSGVTLQIQNFIKYGQICIFSFALRCPNATAGQTLVTLPFSCVGNAVYSAVHDNGNVIRYLYINGNQLKTDLAKTDNNLIIGEITYITND